MRAFTFSRAGDVAEAITRHDAEPETAYVAGGTSLLDLVKLDVSRPRQIVDVNRIGLDRIEVLPNGGLKIGALVKNSDLARHAIVREKYPVLAEAILTGASSQLRNMATTAGNLLQRTRCTYFRDNISPCNKRSPGSGCAAIDGYNRGHAILGTSEHCIATHPSDMCVGLSVLDADVLVQGTDGERRIRFADFHLLPGTTPERESALGPSELITAIEVPPPPAGTRSWYVKLRDRESFAFALTSVAVLFVPASDGKSASEVRLALGGVATKPWRVKTAETELKGAMCEQTIFAQAAEVALEGARAQAHNGFKIDLAKRVIVRALTLVAAGQPPVRNT